MQCWNIVNLIPLSDLARSFMYLLCIHVSVKYSFILPWRTSFEISYESSWVTMNSSAFVWECLPYFGRTVFLNKYCCFEDFISFSIFNISFDCLLVFNFFFRDIYFIALWVPCFCEKCFCSFWAFKFFFA